MHRSVQPSCQKTGAEGRDFRALLAFALPRQAEEPCRARSDGSSSDLDDGDDANNASEVVFCTHEGGGKEESGRHDQTSKEGGPGGQEARRRIGS